MPAQVLADPSNEYADNPAAAKLGQKLYFDARYSSNGMQSCATCHDPKAGFQDARANTSKGVAGFTGRHAPTIYNVAIGSGQKGETVWNFWDGRKDSQWSQALGPPENPVEMGSTRTKIASLMSASYRGEYEAIFGAMPAMLNDANGHPKYPDAAKPGTPEWDAIPVAAQDAITQIYVNFGKSIAAYERTIICRGGAFDTFWTEIAGGASDSDALDADEKAGLALFVGKASCVGCHNGPNFTDWKFENIGVRQEGANIGPEDTGRAAGVAKAKGDEFNCASKWSGKPDKSTCAVATLVVATSDTGAFRNPTLRNISKTGPYMHTGAMATLEDVVAHYNRGGADGGFSGTVDSKIHPLDLSAKEQANLVAFLKALDGDSLDPSLMGSP